MLSPIASNVTVLELTTNQTFHAGSGVAYSVHVANITGAAITAIFRNTADDKDWLVLRVPAGDTRSKECPTVFTGGFVGETVGSGVFATVSHTNPQGA